MRSDINSDTGESFGADTIGHDAGLFQAITSANRRRGVSRRRSVGTPGFPDLVGFGRRELHVTPQEAEDFVLYQIAAVSGVAAAEGVKLQPVRPHGALGVQLEVGDVREVRPIERP